jgi:hypothetical protein
LTPWLPPLILVALVVIGIFGGIPGLVAAVGAALAFACWLRARQLKARGDRDEGNYPRLSDFLRPRR